MTEATFEANPGAPGRARAFVEKVLASRECTKGVVLAVSELVTNVVRHEPDTSELTVSLDIQQDSVLVEVRGNGGQPDHDPSGVANRNQWPEPDELHGRGLSIVETIADRWGVMQNGRHSVWCEITC